MDQSEKDKLRGEWAAKLRELRGVGELTQLDISKHTGATPTAVYRWEAARAVPQLRFFKKLRELMPDLPEPPDCSNDTDSDPEETGEQPSQPPTGTHGAGG